MTATHPPAYPEYADLHTAATASAAADGRVYAYLAEHGRLDLLPSRSANGDPR